MQRVQKACNLLQGIEGEPGPWKTAEDSGRPRKTAEEAEDAEDAEDVEDWPRPAKCSEGQRGPGSAWKAAVSKEGEGRTASGGGGAEEW